MKNNHLRTRYEHLRKHGTLDLHGYTHHDPCESTMRSNSELTLNCCQDLEQVSNSVLFSLVTIVI